MQLCEVRAFGEPVVHLSVNVDCVLGAPGWVDRLVPDALEVCSERAGARTGDEHVATELKVDRQQMKILATGLDCRDALVCGDGGVGIGAEVNGRPAEIPLMIFDVATAEDRVGSARGLGEV